MSDPVNHPPHYNAHPSGVECIDVAEHMNFNRGNALKYLWRAGQKGDELEDLRKAAWYLAREIALVEKQGASGTHVLKFDHALTSADLNAILEFVRLRRRVLDRGRGGA